MNYQIKLNLVQLDNSNAVLRDDAVDITSQFTEFVNMQYNVAPGTSDIDLAAMLQNLGTAAKARAIAIISNVDGVTVEIGTSQDKTAIVGCYPFFFTGLDAGMDVSTANHFVLNLKAHTGDSIATVKLIAYA